MYSQQLIPGFSSLTCSIPGIVHVARNKTIKYAEKVLWIIGFMLIGFVTAIVFLIMAKGRNFVDWLYRPYFLLLIIRIKITNAVMVKINFPCQLKAVTSFTA